MQNALLNRYFINVFQMTAWELLRRTYYLNEQQTKYVSIYLNDDDNLKPVVKIGTPSGHAMLNKLQWFILLTFKSDMPKNEVHELGDPHHTLSVYCGRYICITSAQVLISKKDWSQLRGLASACIDREAIKYGTLQEELAEWCK